LITPGSETDVVNYVEGVILDNHGQVVTVRRHDDIDDLIPISAASNAKIVMAAPATVTDIKVGLKVFVPNGEPM
jgi:hypothetical protein